MYISHPESGDRGCKRPFESAFFDVLKGAPIWLQRGNLVVEWRVTCLRSLPCQLTWKPVGYVQVSGFSTNVEEAGCSSYCSNERRRGSDGFNATAVAVDKNARSDFQRQYAVGGDDPYLKRRGRSVTQKQGKICAAPAHHQTLPRAPAAHGTCNRSRTDHSRPMNSLVDRGHEL